MQRDAVFKEQREQRVRNRLRKVLGFPGFVVGEPQNTITQVAVFTDDVGVRVVQIVMRMAP